MMDVNKYIGEKIRKFRERKNITLQELAEYLNVTPQALSRYERGERKTDQDILFKLANYFNISVNEFFPPLNQYTSDILYDTIVDKCNNFNKISLKTGIPIAELNAILNGENRLPKPLYLKKIADLTGEDIILYFSSCGYINELDNDPALYNSGIRYLLTENDRNDLCEILESLWKTKDNNITKEKIYKNIFEDEKSEFSQKDLLNILNSNNIEFDNATLVDIEENIIKIPVLGVIKAGIPIEAQENIIEYVDIPKDWTKGGKKYYGLKINGDSMYPKYLENDIVIFEQTEDYLKANRKDCAVMVNGDDATFKNVTITENGITLIPLNINNSDGYQPTFYNEEQVKNKPVKIIGIAREKRTRL